MATVAAAHSYFISPFLFFEKLLVKLPNCVAPAVGMKLVHLQAKSFFHYGSTGIEHDCRKRLIKFSWHPN